MHHISFFIFILIFQHVISRVSLSSEGILQCTKKGEFESCNSINNQARYDFYRIYYVHIDTEEQVKLFQDVEASGDSYMYFGHSRCTGQKLTIMVAAHKIADFTNLLEDFKVRYKILTYNFQEKIDRQNKEVQPITISSKEFDWDHYFHLETIYAWMEQLSKDYEYITMIDMGLSQEGIPIKGVKLAHNSNNPTVFIESGIHAREWIAPATATFIINELIKSVDSRVKLYGSSLNWIIVPVVNTDGYKYSFEKDRMWRKNRKTYGSCVGVDLNRNFPFHWNETGSSSNPCAYDFSGSSGGSETETKRLMDFISYNLKTENIKTYIALHSFSQLIMFPYGFTSDKVNNYVDLSEIGLKASKEIERISGKIYKSGSLHETIYPSSGGSKDWAHSIGIPITFTIELRGEPDSEDLFILPAKEIHETGVETLGAVMTIVEEAHKRGYYS